MNSIFKLLINKGKARLLRRVTRKRSIDFDGYALSKIVILRYDRTGDLIVSLPLIKALKNTFLQSEMIVIGSKANASLAAQSEYIDRVIIKPECFLSWVKLLLALRSENISMTVNLSHSVEPHAILAAVMINAPHNASPYKDGRYGVPGKEMELYDIMPAQHPAQYNRPIAETFLDIARHLNCDLDGTIPYPLSNTLRPSISQPYILINRRGSRDSMRLRDSDILNIAELVKQSAPEVTLVIKPQMREVKDIQRSKLAKHACVKILPSDHDFTPMINLVCHARLVITPDTSLVHVASALSVPLVAVFCNNPEQYAQWQPIHSGPCEVIFSQHRTSLDGYSGKQLTNACLKLLANN